MDVMIPYSSGDLLNRMHKEAEIISENYEENGIHVIAICPAGLADLTEKLQSSLPPRNH